MRRLTTLAVSAMAILVLPACGLLLDFDPPQGQDLECFVTVRNPDGMEVVVSSVNHEDFANNRRYFTCTAGPCPSGCTRNTIADSEADWRIWARREIERIAADPSSSSTFRVAGGPWCEVPGTLRCEPRGYLSDRPTCTDITGPDLCIAPPPPVVVPPVGTPPPVGPPCVEVSCPSPPCTTIDFGTLPVGGTASETVTVSNCGTADVRVQIDQTITPTGLRGEFDIPTSAFNCGPRTPDETTFGRILATAPGDSQCTFDIAFQPTMPLDHAAQKVFWSTALPDHTISLTGIAEGGLIDDAPTDVCFEEAAPCSGPRTITLTNSGPGPVIIRSVVAMPADYSIVSPTPSMLPITLNAGDPPLEIVVEWCDVSARRTGQLRINTSERTIIVDLETMASCP